MNWALGSGWTQDGSGRKSPLELQECFLLLLIPGKANLDGGKVGERSGDGTVVLDESAVKVSETQEVLKSLAVVGFRPLLYRPDLLRVHADGPGRDDVSQECGRGAGEFTLPNLANTVAPCRSRSHQGKRVVVIYHYVVYSSVVNAGMQGTVLLSHKEESCSSRGRGRIDDTRCESLAEVLVHSFCLWPRQ